MSLATQFVQALGGLFFATVSAGIGAVTPKIRKLIESHTTAKTATVANDAIAGLTKIVESVVADFNQRIVSDVKAKGGWTPELADQVKKDAEAAVKSQGAQFIKYIDGDTEALISTLIEQAVSKQKGSVR
jgi:hypothetical protein